MGMNRHLESGDYASYIASLCDSQESSWPPDAMPTVTSVSKHVFGVPLHRRLCRQWHFVAPLLADVLWRTRLVPDLLQRLRESPEILVSEILKDSFNSRLLPLLLLRSISPPHVGESDLHQLLELTKRDLSHEAMVLHACCMHEYRAKGLGVARHALSQGASLMHGVFILRASPDRQEVQLTVHRLMSEYPCHQFFAEYLIYNRRQLGLPKSVVVQYATQTIQAVPASVSLSALLFLRHLRSGGFSRASLPPRAIEERLVEMGRQSLSGTLKVDCDILNRVLQMT
jgi:hypothetical protein